MKSIVKVLLLLLPAASLAARPAGLYEALRQLGVSASPDELPAAPVPGFLEVSKGAKVLYVSDDGRLLIDGDIVSLETAANLTEGRRAALRLGLIDKIPASERIVVAAAGKLRTRVVVFADTDCPFCLQLHRHQDDFARRGIEIQYLFFPRSGPGSESFEQAVAVWCAADRGSALAAVLAGARLPHAQCDNPVMAHYQLAMELRLKGTPAIVTADGAICYGALDADKLAVASAAH